MNEGSGPAESGPTGEQSLSEPVPVRGDRRLWGELLRRVRRAQELRRRPAVESGPVADQDALADQAAVDAVDAVDADNSAWLAGVVARRGWPGRAMVGDDGAMAAWMLAQHTDAFPERQQAFLAALEQAVSCGQANPAQQAYLADRVRINAGLPQRYGTQFVVSAAGDRHLLPVEDLPGLAVRRETAGLPPLPEPGS
jgi:hypothetical protein